MRFTVTFEEGVWNFAVESLSDSDPYHEEFTILDLNEAKDAAWDLIEEISAVAEEEDLPDDYFKGDDE